MRPWLRLSRQLEAAQAQDTNLGIARAQYEHAIAILLGESPSSFYARLRIEGRASSVHSRRAYPAELLEEAARYRRGRAGHGRRECCRLASRRRHTSPIVVLGGTGGLESLSFADWFTWPSRFWSVGPAVS